MGEQIFQVLSWSVSGRGNHEARSAGVDPDPGGRAIARRDVEWADVICVMEPEHETYIRKQWPAHGRKIRVLGIPDDIYAGCGVVAGGPQPGDARLADQAGPPQARRRALSRNRTAARTAATSSSRLNGLTR